MPSSKRVPNEYCAFESTPLAVEIVPFPPLRFPCQTADALRCIVPPTFYGSRSFFLVSFSSTLDRAPSSKIIGMRTIPIAGLLAFGALAQAQTEPWPLIQLIRKPGVDASSIRPYVDARTAVNVLGMVSITG